VEKHFLPQIFLSLQNNDTTTSVDDPISLSTNFAVYPNPTDGIFNINIEGLPDLGVSLPVELLDQSGKVVQQTSIGNYSGIYKGQVSLLKYEAGTYFVKVDAGKKLLTSKLIKL